MTSVKWEKGYRRKNMKNSNCTEEENGWFNPFIPNAPSLYPLKTSENRKVFLCFQEVDKRYIGNKWVKNSVSSNLLKDITKPMVALRMDEFVLTPKEPLPNRIIYAKHK